MEICVCIKQTPDSSSVFLDPLSGQVDFERFVAILNPADACAVEAAVRFKERLGGSILVLTVGPQEAEGALRAALALGADQAYRLWHAQSLNWGPQLIAAAISGFLKQRGPLPDLVLCGDHSSDWGSGIVGPALAEQLALPQITSVSLLTIFQETPVVILRATRRLEEGYREELEAFPPLLISVTEMLNEPRYPALPAHLAALTAPIECLDALTLIRQEPTTEATEEIVIEMHAPRPLPRRIAAPDSRHSAFERIGEIIAGGTTGRQTRLVEGDPNELARVLVQFLRERGLSE